MAAVAPDGRVHHQGFLYVMRPPEGERIPVPHIGAKCLCGTEAYLRWSNRPLDPFNAVKKLRLAGWELEVDRTGHPVCPACIKQRRAGRAGDKPAKESAVSPPSATVTPMRPAMSAANANASPRLLTVDEKVKVRNLLDRFFDDAAGNYIGGYSDQRIGEECSVPWASIAALRDMAYGPLKSNPEVEAIRAELLKLETGIAAAERIAQAAVDKATDVKRQMEGFTTRVTEADTRAKEAKDIAEQGRRTLDNLKERLDGVLKRQGIAS